MCGEDDASDMPDATSHPETETVSMVALLTSEEQIFKHRQSSVTHNWNFALLISNLSDQERICYGS